MVVQHNLSAMNSNRQLGITTGIQAKSSEKLSSGYKINRAADDAAGLAISEKMRRQIRGLDQASDNAQDGISMVQIADGAMAEVHDMLQRGNELAVKAANDTLTYQDRSYIQAEIDRIKEEINAINGKTQFNERFVLRGTSHGDVDPGFQVQAGTELPSEYDLYGFTNDYSGLPIDDYHKTTTFINFYNFDGSAEKKQALDGTGFHVSGLDTEGIYNVKLSNGPVSGPNPLTDGDITTYAVDISGATTGRELSTKIGFGIGGMISQGTTLSVVMGYREESRVAFLMVYDTRDEEPMPIDANHGLFGAGLLEKATEFAGEEKDIILQVGSESDADNQITLEMPYINARTCLIDNANVTSHINSLRAIEQFKNGLQFVSMERSRMGAYQNRLEHTIRNLDNVTENTQDAESLIRDTDMAAEMVRYSNNNILAQAGQAMLAQANQTNQGVLSLLQ